MTQSVSVDFNRAVRNRPDQGQYFIASRRSIESLGLGDKFEASDGELTGPAEIVEVRDRTVVIRVLTPLRSVTSAMGLRIPQQINAFSFKDGSFVDPPRTTVLAGASR